MGFPSGTRVYLEDKTLKNIEDLNFGDKILSIKIKNSETLNHFKFYNKYFNLNNNRNHKNVFIKTEDLVLCSATVYSILTYKIDGGCVQLNNKTLFEQNLILIQNGKNSESVYLQSAYSIRSTIEKNDENSHLFLKSLAVEPSNLNIDTANDNFSIDPDRVFLETQINDFNFDAPAQTLVCLILLDNHFLLTENFICFNSLTLDNV